MTRRAKPSVSPAFRAEAHQMLDAYFDSHPSTVVVLIAGGEPDGVDAVCNPPAVSVMEGVVTGLSRKLFPEVVG